jgi:NAD(P) transhydrogenase subunit alpha
MAVAAGQTIMIVGVPGEIVLGERRVAVVPVGVGPLRRAGLEVLVENDAGHAAGFSAEEYRQAGARLAASRSDVLAESDVILQIRVGPDPDRPGDTSLMRPGQIVVGFFDPFGAPRLVDELSRRRVTSFSMQLIPRITRAQSMDALSSMATVAGYKSVLVAADALPKMMPMLMTAAGTIPPARVFVVGAGVAGLMAIATARRLGARVEAYDVRPAVKEQVQSLGARFVELPLETAGAEDRGGYARAEDESFYRRQREMMAGALAAADVVITTAAVPGKQAPILITREMLAGMKPGSVIVDLAAERGGNCEVTRPDDEVVEHGVRVLGPTNLASTVPHDASQMYSRNVTTFLLHLIENGEIRLRRDDDIVRETLVTADGEVVHPRVREALGLRSAAEGAEPAAVRERSS